MAHTAAMLATPDALQAGGDFIGRIAHIARHQYKLPYKLKSLVGWLVVLSVGWLLNNHLPTTVNIVFQFMWVWSENEMIGVSISFYLAKISTVEAQYESLAIGCIHKKASSPALPAPYKIHCFIVQPGDTVADWV